VIEGLVLEVALGSTWTGNHISYVEALLTDVCRFQNDLERYFEVKTIPRQYFKITLGSTRTGDHISEIKASSTAVCKFHKDTKLYFEVTLGSTRTGHHIR